VKKEAKTMAVHYLRKSQKTRTKQGPKFNDQKRLLDSIWNLELGSWSLFGIWCLVLEISVTE
jgi:hypothetical protein